MSIKNNKLMKQKRIIRKSNHILISRKKIANIFIKTLIKAEN